MIYIASKKRKEEKICDEFPNAFLLDVSSTSPQRIGQYLSPFYPHMKLPVPGSNLKSTCVEAIWQALKVFEHEDIDLSLLSNDTGRNLKRSVRKHGKILGHRWLETGELLNYYAARCKIYLPAYWHMLSLIPNARLAVDVIRQKSLEGDVVLLEYNVNDTFTDVSRPLAHAALIKLFIERNGLFPEDLVNAEPLDAEASKQLKKQQQKERRARMHHTKSQGSLFDV